MEEKAKKWMVLKDAHETQGASMSRMAPGLGARLGWGLRFEGCHLRPPTWVRAGGCRATPRPELGACDTPRNHPGWGGDRDVRVCSTQLQARTERGWRGQGHAPRDGGDPHLKPARAGGCTHPPAPTRQQRGDDGMGLGPGTSSPTAP